MHMIAADMRYGMMAAPAVLAFADDPRRIHRLGRAIVASGGRLVADGPFAGAAERIDRQAGSGALVILDVIEDGGDALDALLSRIELGVRTARFAAIIVTTPAMIDLVVARIADPAATILVDPPEDELAEAISRAIAPIESALWESSGEENGRRLAELKEEVGRIARTLARLSDGEDMPSPDEARAERPSMGEDTARSDLAVVRTILRLRRLRHQFLEMALFADPAWDMLLDLTAAQFERRRVAVSSLCIAAAVPPTTALRWITMMTEQGLFRRRPDPDDGRRIFIALSDTASIAMAGYLQAARNTLALTG
jgi:hypothetical protein